MLGDTVCEVVIQLEMPRTLGPARGGFFLDETIHDILAFAGTFFQESRYTFLSVLL